MPTRSSMSSMVTWSRLGYRPPHPPTTRTPRPGPAAQIMPRCWLGASSGQGWDPQDEAASGLQDLPASPRQLRANREVSVRTQEGGAERLKLEVEPLKAFVPARGERQGRMKTSPARSARSIAHRALPWLTTSRPRDGCLQEPSQSLPPRSSPPTAPASPT